MTGQKTVIERQIVGDYEELEKDSWIVSSVKTTVQEPRGSSTPATADRELFMAMKLRDFHMEKIRDYKDEGAIGEANSGLIAYRDLKKYEDSRLDKIKLMKVINKENDARKIIFERTLLQLNKKQPTREEINNFAALFAMEQMQKAKKDDWIQDNTGRWVRK